MQMLRQTRIKYPIILRRIEYRARPRSGAAPAVNSPADVLADSGKQPTRKLVVEAPSLAYTLGILWIYKIL